MATTLLTINITTDEADGLASIGDGLSLRDAVITAISNPDEEFIIELVSGETYFLTLTGSDEDLSESGDLDITNGANITIRSTSEAPAIIDASDLGDPVFDLFEGSSLSIQGNIQIPGDAGIIDIPEVDIPEVDIPEVDVPNIPDLDGSVDLDLDGVDGVVPSVDILNIFRVEAGAPQAVVIPEGAGVSQQEVTEAVDAFPELSLDVDNFEGVVASVDVLNIFRVLAGAPQAIVIPEGANVSQQEVVEAVEALIT